MPNDQEHAIAVHAEHHPAADAVEVVREATESRFAHGMARAGLTARGVVYLLIGVITLRIAAGKSGEADQRGAVAHLLHQPFGTALVLLTAIGLGGYALWRLSEAAFGVVGNRGSTFARLQSAFRGGVYLFFCCTTFAVLLGSNTSQVSQQRGITATVLDHTGGRTVVVAVGVGTVLVSALLLVEGVTRRFMRYFPAALATGTRRLVEVTGTIGATARSIVFAIAGVLLVGGAWEYEPAGASGIDGAVRWFRDNGGIGALLVAGLGLVVFGLYGLLEARFRRV